MSTPLAEQMRAAAESAGPIAGQNLLLLADELDAQDGSNPLALLAAWARARRAYCAFTGDPLV